MWLNRGISKTPSNASEKYTKFNVPPSELVREKSLKIMTPTENNIKKLKEQELENMKRAYKDSYDMLNLEGRGDPDTELELKELQDRYRAVGFYQAQQELEQIDNKIDKNFSEDFIMWLKGEGRKEDHAITPWGKKNLAVLPDVKNYLNMIFDKRWEYNEQLIRMKMMPPTNLKELYMYYKYILRGKALDPENVNYLEFIDKATDFTPGSSWKAHWEARGYKPREGGLPPPIGRGGLPPGPPRGPPPGLGPEDDPDDDTPPDNADPNDKWEIEKFFFNEEGTMIVPTFYEERELEEGNNIHPPKELQALDEDLRKSTKPGNGQSEVWWHMEKNRIKGGFHKLNDPILPTSDFFRSFPVPNGTLDDLLSAVTRRHIYIIKNRSANKDDFEGWLQTARAVLEQKMRNESNPNQRVAMQTVLSIYYARLDELHGNANTIPTRVTHIMKEDKEDDDFLDKESEEQRRKQLEEDEKLMEEEEERQAAKREKERIERELKEKRDKEDRERKKREVEEEAQRKREKERIERELKDKRDKEDGERKKKEVEEEAQRKMEESKKSIDKKLEATKEDNLRALAKSDPEAYKHAYLRYRNSTVQEERDLAERVEQEQMEARNKARREADQAALAKQRKDAGYDSDPDALVDNRGKKKDTGFTLEGISTLPEKEAAKEDPPKKQDNPPKLLKSTTERERDRTAETERKKDKLKEIKAKKGLESAALEEEKAKEEKAKGVAFVIDEEEDDDDEFKQLLASEEHIQLSKKTRIRKEHQQYPDASRKSLETNEIDYDINEAFKGLGKDWYVGEKLNTKLDNLNEPMVPSTEFFEKRKDRRFVTLQPMLEAAAKAHIYNHVWAIDPEDNHYVSIPDVIKGLKNNIEMLDNRSNTSKLPSEQDALAKVRKLYEAEVQRLESGPLFKMGHLGGKPDELGTDPELDEAELELLQSAHKKAKEEENKKKQAQKEEEEKIKEEKKRLIEEKRRLRKEAREEAAEELRLTIALNEKLKRESDVLQEALVQSHTGLGAEWLDGNEEEVNAGMLNHNRPVVPSKEFFRKRPLTFMTSMEPKLAAITYSHIFNQLYYKPDGTFGETIPNGLDKLKSNLVRLDEMWEMAEQQNEKVAIALVARIYKAKIHELEPPSAQVATAPDPRSEREREMEREREKARMDEKDAEERRQRKEEEMRRRREREANKQLHATEDSAKRIGRLKVLLATKGDNPHPSYPKV